jgi:hypothetical protein
MTKRAYIQLASAAGYVVVSPFTRAAFSERAPSCAYLLPLVRVSTRDRVAGVATFSGLHHHACMLVLHGDDVNMKRQTKDQGTCRWLHEEQGFFLFIYLK